ncbi:hypothetical protein HAX54_021223, partial [Datura stramonium]|nr:hypothetical protein [Datura stramonium]
KFRNLNGLIVIFDVSQNRTSRGNSQSLSWVGVTFVEKERGDQFVLHVCGWDLKFVIGPCQAQHRVHNEASVPIKGSVLERNKGPFSDLESIT